MDDRERGEVAKRFKDYPNVIALITFIEGWETRLEAARDKIPPTQFAHIETTINTVKKIQEICLSLHRLIEASPPDMQEFGPAILERMDEESRALLSYFQSLEAKAQTKH